MRNIPVHTKTWQIMPVAIDTQDTDLASSTAQKTQATDCMTRSTSRARLGLRIRQARARTGFRRRHPGALVFQIFFGQPIHSITNERSEFLQLSN